MDLPAPFQRAASGGGLRAFADFQGALTSATPTFNGTQLAEHQGGYLPFSYELTDYLVAGDNILGVSLDSTWQNVPPDGNSGGATSVDYLEPGGINRDVALRFVPQVFIADVFASPAQVLTTAPVVNVQATIDAAVVPAGPVQVLTELYGSGQPLASASAQVQISAPGQVTASLQLTDLGPVQLWDPEHPNLYQVVTTVTISGQPVHDFTRSIGFREAVFQTDGFFLNGNLFKLFGLDRHQLYPYYGMAMPARVQRHDARDTQEPQLQHGALLALPAVPRLPGRMRRTRDHGLGGNPGLGLSRRRGVAVDHDAERSRHGGPRSQPAVRDHLGGAAQRGPPG